MGAVRPIAAVAYSSPSTLEPSLGNLSEATIASEGDIRVTFRTAQIAEFDAFVGIRRFFDTRGKDSYRQFVETNGNSQPKADV
jgi:hypothetical protein